jgi:DtxR family Mn-dependent transcriptional regulator
MLSASLEDYLEAILLLERESRVARVSEISRPNIHVSRPSVTGALKNLAGRGLVAHQRYGHATLTEEGERIALEVERRHVAIRDFLTEVLSIPAVQAETTACKLEHVLEPEHPGSISWPTQTLCATGGRHDHACPVVRRREHRVGSRPCLIITVLARRLIALGLTP